MTNLVETPLDDHSPTLYTSLDPKYFSIVQLNFVIAKLSSFIHVPTTHNINTKINNVFSKHVPLPTDSSFVPPTAVVPPISSSYVLQTANPNVSINSFSCSTKNVVTEILNFLGPHDEPSANTDHFIILNHIFDTYRPLQNLLHLHNHDIQSLTLSTIHVNDFLEKPVLLQTPTFPVSS